MNGIAELDNNFILPDNFDVSVFDSFPVVKHIYGQPMENEPSTIYWLEYQPGSKESGTISFARRLYLEYPELAKHVLDYIQLLFPTMPLDIVRVNLVRTKGSIQAHIDESLRKCCINIGVKNTSIATTFTSKTKDYKLFEIQKTSIVCQDRHAYLLDTNNIHEVITSNNDEYRYMITYGFGRPFEEIYNFYKPRHNTENLQTPV